MTANGSGNDGGWLSLRDEEVFATPIFKIGRELSRCLRNGVEHYFYYLDCASWVTVVAVTGNDELVMIRQYRHGSGQMELEVPGGGVNRDGEEPVAAGLRELREETGYTGDNARIIGRVNPNPALHNNTCYTVLVENCRKVGEPELEDTEELSVFTVPLADVEKMIVRGEISHALVVNAWYFFDLSRRTV